MLALFDQLFASLRGNWEPAFDETMPAAERGTVEIADPDIALTFARADVEGRRRLLAVTAYRGGIVAGTRANGAAHDAIAGDAARKRADAGRREAHGRHRADPAEVS